jgi:hypothetical protein
MIELLLILSIFLIIGFTLYGAALILSEHFFIGLLVLLFLSPIFFIWAFFKGIIGKTND